MATPNPSIHHLISFYNNNQTIIQPAAFSEPEKKLIERPAEECYQIDLQQWLSLGQPQPTAAQTQAKKEQEAAPRPSTSRPRPPVPPRKHAKKPTTQAPRHPQDLQDEDDFAEDDDDDHTDDDDQGTIDLGCFRKAIQALWATLIHQHYPHYPSHHQHSYYDTHNQKITLPGAIVRAVWTRSGLDMPTLAQIWESVDGAKRGQLTFEQFLMGTYQITKMRRKRGLWPGGRATPPTSTGAAAPRTPAGRRTPPLVHSSRSASVCSSASSSDVSLLDLPLSLHHRNIPILHPDSGPRFFNLPNSFLATKNSHLLF
ncbi:hypothetical protein PTTG_06096 [Puccinia triticina 1-1 BBBD Race 1]|uniref:EH domain-containing protein n=1 Tax=Puccinia triticina (isolate 1-1 / race 1 (BBBD)) TaxID=630390 RepID=A0A180GKJ2_PUCT1|nr:hypothetical protein PTTG_06096 [Puccinia triticina 1-1 BBBD Race 1]